MKTCDVLTIGVAMLSLGCFTLGSSPALAQARPEIQFLAVGDIHSTAHVAGTNDGCPIAPDYLLTSSADQNVELIKALNAIETPTWPETLVNGNQFYHATPPTSSDHFGAPRGLLIAGDLTESGRVDAPCNEWEKFVARFPVKGGVAPGQVVWDTFEGYGNHDFPYEDGHDQAARNAAEAKKKVISSRITTRSDDPNSATNDRKSTLLADFDYQTDGSGSYYWDWEDIRFFNLNLKPSGGVDSIPNQTLHACTLETNRAHSDDTGRQGTAQESDDIQCREVIHNTNKGYRIAHPNRALKFLQTNLNTNSQIVIMSHYGPFSQDRLANDEIWSLCAVLKSQEVRAVAWLVGHTHKSDYYEWSCGKYIVPVFNVGSAFYDMDDNAELVHFAYFRIGDNWLEALDVGYRPSTGEFSFGSNNQPAGTSIDECNKATLTGANFLDTDYHPLPFGQRQQAIFDAAGNADAKYCNPDGKYGGWLVRVPICSLNTPAYSTSSTPTNLITNCQGIVP